ncbi:MAG: Fe(3+) ABC transporter substrate-binding protein [Bacteroidota bacterium]
MRKLLLLLIFTNLITACGNNKGAANDDQFITLYTHRHYDTDQKIFDQFAEQTGIAVKVVNASSDELIQKMVSEGKQSPADLLITVDAGRLVRAKTKNLLQPVQSQKLEQIVPEYLRDADNNWFALTKRARVMVYDKNTVNPATLSTYEDLAKEQWKGRILIRSSGNIYNQSLLASIIANNGAEQAETWAKGMVENFARPPRGNDRDQVKAIAAQDGEVAIINTYYLGRMLNSENPTEKKAGESVSVFFPNQADRGTHINISGIGLARNAPHPKEAIQFMEYLVSKEVQEIFANSNYEYPVNVEAKTSELLQSWGDFKEDKLTLSKLGELNKAAVIIFDKVGWK